MSFIDVIYVKGTVKSEYFRDMLGLVNEEKKVMITGLIAGNLSEQLLEELVTKLNFDKPNTGIAFVVPVDKLSVWFGRIKMESTNMKALYIVVNAGFAEQVVDYIRSRVLPGPL